MILAHKTMHKGAAPATTTAGLLPVARAEGPWSPSRSKAGASLIVALFFMLVCIAVCTVVVANAAVVSTSLAQKAENDRFYNAASSAINQIDAMFSDADSLGAVSYSITSLEVVSSSLPTALQEGSSSSIEQRIESWIETALKNRADSASTEQTTTTTASDDDLVAYVTVKLSDDDKTELPRVKLSFSMDDDLVITLCAVCVADADDASTTDADQTTEGPVLEHLYSKHVDETKGTFTYATSTQSASTESTDS